MNRMTKIEAPTAEQKVLRCGTWPAKLRAYQASSWWTWSQKGRYVSATTWGRQRVLALAADTAQAAQLPDTAGTVLTSNFSWSNSGYSYAWVSTQRTSPM